MKLPKERYQIQKFVLKEKKNCEASKREEPSTIENNFDTMNHKFVNFSTTNIRKLLPIFYTIAGNKNKKETNLRLLLPLASQLGLLGRKSRKMWRVRDN